MNQTQTLPERWRTEWRAAIAPLLSNAALEALREGLATNDPALMQGATAYPHGTLNGECRGACALGYALWRGDGLRLVWVVERQFNRLLGDIARRIRGRVAFIDWFDHTPRHEMIAALLPEVEYALSQRRAAGVVKLTSGAEVR